MGADTYPPKPITHSAPFTICSDLLSAWPNLNGASSPTGFSERGKVTFGIEVNL